MGSSSSLLDSDAWLTNGIASEPIMQAVVRVPFSVGS